MERCTIKSGFGCFVTIFPFIAIIFLDSVVCADLITGYEPSETPPLTITSTEMAPQMVQGGVAGATAATEGGYVLKCAWTGQPDGKVEIKHTGLNFDLAGFNWLLVDIYTTTDLFDGSPNGVIGIWNSSWTPNWQGATSIPPAANQWHTLAIDVSGYTQTGLTQIQAFVLDYMSVSSGTFYLDNMRTAVDIPLYRPADNPMTTEPGLRYEYFTGIWTKLPEFEALDPVEKGFVDNFDITGATAVDNFGYSFKGYIDIATKGTYTFYTNSDDGSELYIGSNLVVDNNGTHTSAESSGSINLEAGKHAITVNYFDSIGPQELAVSYSGPGIAKTTIPDNVLYKYILPGDVNDDGQADLDDLAVIGGQWLSTYGMTDIELLANNWLKGNIGLHIKDGWLMLNNEKFFIKGIGYEVGARPGQYPWNRTFEPNVITMDINRIIDARFNTIRTWAPLTEPELQLIDSMGLKIIFGIWVDPAGDFGNSAFIAAAENDLRNTLTYSKNYDSIITYLIMNEPKPEDIFAAGAAETAALWDRLKTIIHTEHPGIPVSFSNTGWSKFIDMNAFDVSGYNLYMYGPAVKHSFGYTGFVEEHKNAAPDNPLIVTEFGLSVSPSGPGGYGYRGNTLTEQTDGNLSMYRGLIDGNAQGGCVFNYLDGWWKNAEIPNDAETHEDEAEEWFGLFGIVDETSDPNGTARPVWDAFKNYNACIITSPKNAQIYNTADIPLELFPHHDIQTIRIKQDAMTVYEKATNSKSYIKDTLTLSIAETIKDVALQFEFLDHADAAIKTETICFLYAQSTPILPDFTLSVPLDDLNDASTCPIQITIDNSSTFTIKDNRVDYSFYPHSWVQAQMTTLTTNPQTINDSFSIPAETEIVTISAGITIQYGQFEKRLYRQKEIQRGTWANPICRKNTRNIPSE